VSARAEPTGFLYPFIESDERDSAALLAALAASAEDKINESRALRISSLARCADVLEQAGAAMARRFRRGGRRSCSASRRAGGPSLRSPWSMTGPS
jgi:hypothetical protein